MTEYLSEDQKYKIIPIVCKYTTIFHSIHEDSIELALFANEKYMRLFTDDKSNLVFQTRYESLCLGQTSIQFPIP